MAILQPGDVAHASLVRRGHQLQRSASFIDDEGGGRGALAGRWWTGASEAHAYLAFSE
jgi:hypothetical protein